MLEYPLRTPRLPMTKTRIYLRALRNATSDGINGASLGGVALLVLKLAGIANCSWTVVACYFIALFVIENARANL